MGAVMGCHSAAPRWEWPDSHPWVRPFLTALFHHPLAASSIKHTPPFPSYHSNIEPCQYQHRAFSADYAKRCRACSADNCKITRLVLYNIFISWRVELGGALMEGRVLLSLHTAIETHLFIYLQRRYHLPFGPLSTKQSIKACKDRSCHPSSPGRRNCSWFWYVNCVLPESLWWSFTSTVFSEESLCTLGVVCSTAMHQYCECKGTLVRFHWM